MENENEILELLVEMSGDTSFFVEEMGDANDAPGMWACRFAFDETDWTTHPSLEGIEGVILTCNSLGHYDFVSYKEYVRCMIDWNQLADDLYPSDLHPSDDESDES